jgi:hypothetical protein
MFLYMDKFFQTSNLHCLCVSHAFLMYHLYDGRKVIDQYLGYVHKQDAIRGCSHQPAIVKQLSFACSQIEMSHNNPRNESLIFLLFTCSLSFSRLFERSKFFSNHNVELDHISSRIKFLFANFSIMIVNLRYDFLQIVGTLAMENRIKYYFFFNLD